MSTDPIEALSPALRRRIAELWARDALLEHVSIASFARFSLQLLAVGAPPGLLGATHRAALDEIEHARACFELAERYGGVPVAPGPLPLSGDLLGATDLPTLAVEVARDGCVGETTGVAEAIAALDRVEIAPVRVVLERIAADEARHAELAWAFVRWALDAGGVPVREAVRVELRRALEGERPLPPADPDAAVLARHGRLDERTLHAVRRRARDEVLGPTVEALFEGGSGRGRSAPLDGCAT